MTTLAQNQTVEQMAIVAPTSFSVLDNTIRIVDGLYSLNDLHEVSGGENKHRPTFFLANDQTKALIAEIEQNFSSVDIPTVEINSEGGNTPSMKINQSANLQSAVKVINGGLKRGTYVCRELVYAYAMWISAKFHLLVIRAFDAIQSQPIQPLQISRQTITPEQKAALHDIVATRAGGNRKVFAQMWSRHNKHFRIAKYEELLAIHFDDAVEYLETMELTTPKASIEELPDFLSTRQAMAELMQTMSQYMDSLKTMMQGAGCAMPQFPLMNMERYTQSMMVNMLLSQTFTLRFNHNMQMELEPIAKQTMMIDPTDSRSIKNLVPRIPMAQLAEVAQAMIAEMGKRSLLLGQ